MDSQTLSNYYTEKQKINYNKAIEKLFQVLLTDPEKRALVLEFFVKEGLINRQDVVTNVKKIHTDSQPKTTKVKNVTVGSPSGLLRRRALQQMNNNAAPEDTVKQTNKILNSVTAYCEVKSSKGDRSEAVKMVLQSLGATVRDRFSSDVTHVIFRDGSNITYRKAKMAKVHLVSVLWLEAVRRHNCKVPETLYPVVGHGIRNSNVTRVCQKLQNEFDDGLMGNENVNSKNKTCWSSKSLSLTCDSIQSVLTSESEDELSEKLNKSCKITSGGRKKSKNKMSENSDSPDTTDEGRYLGNLDPRRLKNSFELEKASKIRSPTNRSNEPSISSFDITDDEDNNEMYITNEKRMQLRISDETNEGSSEKNNEANCRKTLFHEGNLTLRRSKKMSMTCLSMLNEENSISKIQEVDATENTTNTIDVIPDTQLKPKLRKLYWPEQPIDLTLFNWNQNTNANTKRDTSYTTKTQKKHQLPHILSVTLKTLQKNVPNQITSQKTTNKIPQIILTRIDDKNVKTKHKIGAEEDESPNKRKKTINDTTNKKTTFVAKKTRKPPKNSIQKPSKKPSALQFYMDKYDSRRSTLDFEDPKVRKELQMSKLTQSKPKPPSGLVFTLFCKEDIVTYSEIVKKLGRFFIEDKVSKKTTHLVAANPSRSINMLKAICRGCWILNTEWLLRSLEADKWLFEENYEMTEFSDSVQRNRMDKQSFGNYFSINIFGKCGKIFISRSTTPPFKELEELVTLCGGKLVKSSRNANIIIGESRNNNNNAVCVNEKWVLESIVENKRKSMKHFLLK